MKVARDSLTLGAIDALVKKGYVVEVEADSDWVEIHKAESEDENVAA